MRFWEAMKEMQNGKKVKQSSWVSPAYIYYNKESTNILFEGGEEYNGALHEDSVWQIYQEPKPPETVELTLWGYVDASGEWYGSWFNNEGSTDSFYRKTDQTRTVTFAEGD